ncbi:MAG: Gfo/Idh/MocA family oxidoreductase [Chloroflexi bacterium]|nr:Gfo/Idh/MocA family oxidoreductase [Chloroflexota bacterium]
MTRIRIAQYGTKHGHAAGKISAMRQNSQVELAGVFEPDPLRRLELQRENSGPYRDVHWFHSAQEMLADPTILAVASEGRNDESLPQTLEIVQAGKHVWYDKPAGDDWNLWQQIMATATGRGTLVQMGYMFRYHVGFRQIADWARSGLLGQIFAVRANMSTRLSPDGQQVIARHSGGIFFDLGGHMLDQIIWMLGRPTKVTAFLRRHLSAIPEFKDNSVVVLEYEKALAFIDIAATAALPASRRFEVHGHLGSAIMEPFEPPQTVRLILQASQGNFQTGEHVITLPAQSRQDLYNLELDAFLAAIQGQRPPDRSPQHDLLVQETLLRATGGIPGS